MKAALLDTNPEPIKYFMNLMGMPAGPCRLPIAELSSDTKKVLEQIAIDSRLIATK